MVHGIELCGTMPFPFKLWADLGATATRLLSHAWQQPQPCPLGIGWGYSGCHR